MAINILEWRRCFHRRKLLTRVSSAGGFGFFHSVLLQKIVSSLAVRNAMNTIVVQNGLLTLSEHHYLLVESNVIRTMADQGFQASKSQQLDNEATEANVFFDSDKGKGSTESTQNLEK
jgi:hypothetical protein